MKVSQTRKVLLVGGDADVALAACRWVAGAGHEAALLRWHAQRSCADVSKHCSESVWLGSLDDGVEAWLARLSEQLAVGGYDAVWSLDGMAHELLCSDHWRANDGVQVVGPSAAAYAIAADRMATLELARSIGLPTERTLHLQRNGPHVEPSAWPCVLRPQREALVDSDEPATFSTRRINTIVELDNRLRDDLPRVGLLLQAPAAGWRRSVTVFALAGELTTVLPVDPGLLDAARKVASALRWSGWFHLEMRDNQGQLAFADLRCGITTVHDVRHEQGVRAVQAVLGTSAVGPSHTGGGDWMPLVASVVARLGCTAAKIALRARVPAWRLLGGNAGRRTLHPSDAVLFVCKGNINRSLVAEQVLRQHGFSRVTSAGLIGMSGRRPSRAAEAFVEEHLGRPAASLRSSSLPRALARLPVIDAVVCFERRHVVELLQRYPRLRGRVYLLTTLACASDGGIDITDPHGQSSEAYQSCFERIEALLGQVVARSIPATACPVSH
jgi:protein-tyrosine-phosphatase